MSSRPTAPLPFLFALALAPCALAQDATAPAGATSTVQAPGRAPYGFPVWHDDWPVPLDLPTHGKQRHYDRTRRQALERVVANLQGNVRREVWQMATEFFWRAPEDAIEPLIAAMDRAYSQPELQDVVKNDVEAMGKMGREEFDDALRRALEHPSSAVRNAVYASLGRSGTAETVRRCFPFFYAMDGHGRAAWLRAARLRLGDDAVAMFTQLMVPDTIGPVRDQVLKETLELPPQEAAKVLARLWPEAVGDFKAIIAGVLHAAGEVSGTVWLRDALRSDDPARITQALLHGARGPLGELRQDALKLSTHPDAAVRLAVARALAKEEGEEVDNTYEVLAQPDEMFETKALALRELTRRGRGSSVAALLEDVATATGTRLEIQLNLLGASGDPRAVEVFAQRFESAPAGEGRQFLRGLAYCGAPGAAKTMLKLFLGPERVVDHAGREGAELTTVNYIPVLLPNLRGQELEVLGAWSTLPRADHRRRSLFLQAATNIGADREDPAIRGHVDGILRSVLFDREELPQLRIQALNALTMRALTIDDAMQLKRRQDDEAVPMRTLLQDYLHEYF